MNKALAFDDVLIVPRFSKVESRKHVDTYSEVVSLPNLIPVITSNMDTVTGVELADVVLGYGGLTALHRFQSIEENVKQFKEIDSKLDDKSKSPIVSVGLGKEELNRARALYEAGARVFLIDVAHGATEAVAEQYNALRHLMWYNSRIIVGNFATFDSYEQWRQYTVDGSPDGVKVGIGSGSLCTTRMVTGCGLPTLATILDFKQNGCKAAILADGGIKNSGDLVKALAAGASAVFCGSLFASTVESEGPRFIKYGDTYTRIDQTNMNSGIAQVMNKWGQIVPAYKQYRGSASKSSYDVQAKTTQHRTPEGEETMIQVQGNAVSVLQQLEAGLRSAMSYVGATTIKEFQEKAELVEITNSGYFESKAHKKL